MQVTPRKTGYESADFVRKNWFMRHIFGRFFFGLTLFGLIVVINSGKINSIVNNETNQDFYCLKKLK